MASDRSDDTVVRSTCPGCGTVDLPADQVTLLVAGDGAAPRYRFTCPSCHDMVDKPTTSRAAAMLRLAGARLVVTPGEPGPPGAGPAGSPGGGQAGTAGAGRLDLDDLAAFAAQLAAVEDIAAAAARRE